MGKADHADRGGEEQKQPARGFGAVDAPSEPSHGESGKERREGARQACSGFANAEELETERRAPVIEDRLFKPGLAVEARRDPIAGFGHVASDPGVAWLIRADETDGTEIVEIADVKCGEDQHDPGETRRGERGLCDPVQSCQFASRNDESSIVSVSWNGGSPALS